MENFKYLQKILLPYLEDNDLSDEERKNLEFYKKEFKDLEEMEYFL